MQYFEGYGTLTPGCVCEKSKNLKQQTIITDVIESGVLNYV